MRCGVPATSDGEAGLRRLYQVLFPAGGVGCEDIPGARLGIKDTAFTINGEPQFLLGISYYGALGALEETVRRDLAEIKRRGFNGSASGQPGPRLATTSRRWTAMANAASRSSAGSRSS